MKVREAVFAARDRLASAGIQCADPLMHARQIAEVVWGWDNAELFRRWEEPVTEEQTNELAAFLDRRCVGEPFQYIVGYEWFWKSRFSVGPGVLIPRKETEVLVEYLLAQGGDGRQRCLELGAGSGNIGITVLLERPQWRWRAFEVNPDSWPYLRRNVRSLLPAEANYEIQEGDYFAGVAGDRGGWDWVVGNCPYVPTEECGTLAAEVRREPPLALDGGPDGLRIVERFVAGAPALLAPGGRILGEMAEDQGPRVTELLKSAGFGKIQILCDYAGRPRVFTATKES